MSTIRNCLVSLKAIDYFKFTPAPKFVGGEERSAFGVLGTIILIGIMLAYMSNSTVRFFTAPPSTTILQSPTTDEAHQFLPTCINTPHLTDLRYFGYSFHQIVLDSEGFKIKGKESALPLFYPDNDTICIDYKSKANNTYLKNACTPSCTFIKFKIWICGTDDPKNPAFPGQPEKCEQGENSAYNILLKNYVKIKHNTSTGTSLLNAAPKTNYSSFYSTTFAINETRSSPDFLRWWDLRILFELKPVLTRYALQYAFPPTGPTAEVMEVQMSMDSNRFVTVQTRQTVLDLVGSFGAFFGVITGALALIFASWNQKGFYERVPEWAQIDDHFEVEKGSRGVVDSEAQKLLSHANLATSAPGVADVTPRSATYGQLA